MDTTYNTIELIKEYYPLFILLGLGIVTTYGLNKKIKRIEKRERTLSHGIEDRIE